MPSSGRKLAGAGFAGWPHCRTVVAAMAALLLLPMEASHAGWLYSIDAKYTKTLQ